ncbi:lipopolysaccharide biosynthesis protein [Meiothermus sp.]|uniref:lipopolysaccharide biosynthesis protein n=1 Tax=Meiothermus sp. TaxID=1955249 RepID=UPI0021DBAD48|nr:oligosaccharide flippase family protein [Meiothermus sp.]GIW33096.1 MAG: polysaccharide biosynthesis protein [Meiothermus sp.]
MTRIKRLLTQPSFAGNAALLASSTILGQGLVILVQPLLTRMYRPEDFGLLALYTSILSLAAVVLNLRYEQAIQLPKEETEARNLLVLSLVLGLGSSVLIGVAFILLRQALSGWFNIVLPVWFAWLVLLGLACVALMQAGSMWALRLSRFGVLAQTKFQQGLWQALGQVLPGLFSPGAGGLILGDVLGRLGGVHALVRLWPRTLQGISVQSLYRVAHRYRSFLIYGTGAALLTAASFHLPFIVLTAFFGAAAMGQFSLSYRITTIPVTLVAQSIGQVFFSRAAAARDTPALAQLTERTAAVLFALGLPVFGALWVVAPVAFPLVFGANWDEAGRYAQLLAPYLLFSMVAQPLSNLLTIREWQRGLLAFTIFELLLRMGAIYWGVTTQQMYWAVVLFALSSLLVALLSIGLFFRAAGASWPGFWLKVRKYVWFDLLGLLLLWGAGYWLKGWWWVGAAVLVVFLLLLRSFVEIRREGLE